MKNFKRFVAFLMMATLFSTSFTSCVDNDVDPAVLSIYESQADLIAAQVAVKQAEAALLEAEAAHENAMAALTEAEAAQAAAIAEGIEDDNAFKALKRVQELMILEAETAAEVARLQNEMALAQQQFENDMAELLADLAEAGAQIAEGYAADYAMAMSDISNLKQDRVELEDKIAAKELYLELMALGITNAETVLAGIIADKDAMITANNAMISAYEAVLADPTTLAAQVDDLKAMIDGLKADCDDYNLQIAELENQVAVLYDEYDSNDDLTFEYDQKLAFHDNLVSLQKALMDANETLQEDIDTYTDALTDYDGVKAGLETAAADATQAVADAWTALGATDAAGDDVAWDAYFTLDADEDPIAAEGVKYATPANLKEELVNANIDMLDADMAKTDAQDALDALQIVIDGLEGTLNTAAADLANEQDTYDTGIGAITTANSNAITAITTAELGVTTATTNYELWRDRFESAPVVNGGFYWEDTTSPSVILGDDILGVQDPNTGTAAASFVRVETWTYVDIAPVGTDPNDIYVPATIGVAQQATIDGVAEIAIAGNGNISAADALLAFPNNADPLTEIEYYVEVGTDDTSTENLIAFQAATATLGNEDIMDVMPILTDIALVGTDAYTILWNAHLTQLGTQDDLDNFGTNLADAQKVYDDLKAVYENELTLLNAAQADLEMADDNVVMYTEAYDDAKEAVDEAAAELGQDFAEGEAGDTPREPTDGVPTDSLTLNEQEYNAEIELADFCETTKEEIQDMIDGWMKTMAQNDLEIAEYQIGIDKAAEEVAELQDAYDALMETPFSAQLLVDIYELYDQMWAIEDMKDADEDAISAMENTIDALEAYGDYMSSSDIQTIIDNLMTANVALEAAKEQAVIDLELTESDQLEDAEKVEMIQRWIDLFTEQLDDIDAEIAALEILAAEYKAQMEAALS